MGEPREPDRVMLIVAAFSGQEGALQWATEQLQQRFGPIALESAAFEFGETKYYEPEMGPGLKKKFLAFRTLIQPTDVVAIKLETNKLEVRCARMRGRELMMQGRLPNGGQTVQSPPAGPAVKVTRPLNIDPAYLCAGKLVLATTKNQAHRIYLGQGIYAEVTLRYQNGEFVAWPWTYPNYRREDYRAFFQEAREVYLQLLRELGQGVSSEDLEQSKSERRA